MTETSTNADILCHHIETNTVRYADVTTDTKDICEDVGPSREVVNKIGHEPLESFNVSSTSKCSSTVEHKKQDAVEDFADLTISEKEILEVIGEELQEDVQNEDTIKERKIPVPSSNVVAKSNLAQVIIGFLIL
jgi:hypothetical protein